MCVSIVRKHDGKRLKLSANMTFDDSWYDDGQLRLFGSGYVGCGQSRHDATDRIPQVATDDSYPYISGLNMSMALSKVGLEDRASEEQQKWTLDEIRIWVDHAEYCEDAIITTVDGMLQMLECPCYAALWR